MRRLASAAKRTVCHLLRDLRNHRPPANSFSAARIVAVTHSLDTQIALHVAAFHEDWEVMFAPSQKRALQLLVGHNVDALFYDYDHGEGDWRNLCIQSLRQGVYFQMVCSTPTDDLFLAVMSAGGAGVLWRPLTSPQLISSVRFIRSLGEVRRTSTALKQSVACAISKF